MDFDKFKKDLYDEIAPLFDENQTPFVDIYAKKGAITYLLGHINSIGLHLKEIADSERQAKIQLELDEINVYANGAFARIDFLSEFPLPKPKGRETGTKPKQTDSVNNGNKKDSDFKNGSVKNGKRKESTANGSNSQKDEPLMGATSSAEKPPEAVGASEPKKISDIGASDPKASDPIFNAILHQIRAEFAKLKEEHDLNKKKSSKKDSEYCEIPSDSSNDEPRNHGRNDQPLNDRASYSRKNGTYVGGPTRNKRRETVQPRLELKFNKYQLSEFDGDPTKWITFRDEFLSMIDSNHTLQDQLKLQQLRSALKGDALEALNGFVLCDADYKPAWEVLFNRYNNTHRIVQSYMKSFFELPKLSNRPTAKQFLHMANKTNQILRVMPTFRIDVSSWDPILMYNLLSKLDTDTYRKWNDQIKKREKIPLSELLEFLEVQASENLAAPPEHVRERKVFKDNGKKGERAHVHVAIKEHKCVKCELDDHHTFQCKMFKGLPVKERIKCIQKAKNCISCFKKHEPRQCSFKPCRYCKKGHNDLLCLQHEKEVQPEEKKEAEPEQTQKD